MGFEKRPAFRSVRLADADFSGARLHAPIFEGTKITDGWFLNADISGDIEGLRVNGVKIAPFVEAELIRRFPDRAKLHATDPRGLVEAWAMIEDRWSDTVERAGALPEPTLHEQVDDEWSFVETLRHLVCATDTWLLRMVRYESRPLHPWGVAGSWLTDPRGIGLEPDAVPSLDDVLEVRRGRMDAVRDADSCELARGERGDGLVDSRVYASYLAALSQIRAPGTARDRR
ncbi:MAG: DinB family protein [Acidimicrobiales bacterium]